jgi:hypothetical protein
MKASRGSFAKLFYLLEKRFHNAGPTQTAFASTTDALEKQHAMANHETAPPAQDTMPEDTFPSGA